MARPHNIVHFITSLHYGGAEQVLITLVESLQRQGYRQTVLYIYPGPHLDTLQALGIACYQVKGLVHRYDPFFMLRLMIRLHALKPDLLHTSLWMANWAGRIAAFFMRIPIVHAYHNRAELDGRVRNMLDYITGARLIPAIAASSEAASSLSLKGIKTSAIQVIINGVAPQKIGAYSQRKEDSFIIGMVARFYPTKNHILLLKALSLLKRQGYAFKAILLGDTPPDSLVAFIKQEGLDQEVSLIIGKLSRDYLPLLHCFVLPSLSEGGVSLALQEAMAFRLPCIISHEANVAGIIEDGINGLLVPGNNEQALAQALLLLMGDNALIQRLGIAAQESIKARFSPEKMVSQYKEVFEQIIECKSCLH